MAVFPEPGSREAAAALRAVEGWVRGAIEESGVAPHVVHVRVAGGEVTVECGSKSATFVALLLYLNGEERQVRRLIADLLRDGDCGPGPG